MTEERTASSLSSQPTTRYLVGLGLLFVEAADAEQKIVTLGSHPQVFTFEDAIALAEWLEGRGLRPSVLPLLTGRKS